MSLRLLHPNAPKSGAPGTPVGFASAYGSVELVWYSAYPGLIRQRASAPRNAPGL